MAESAMETRKGRRAAAMDTEDSIEAEFGGDYSEGSLELFRQLGRKGAQFGEVEPWEKQADQPPAQEDCDAAIEQLEALNRSLDQVKQYVPDAKELEWIDYKRALVENASDKEVTWLKLKAYHHGLDKLRASASACAAQQDGAGLTPSSKDAKSLDDSNASAHPNGVAAAREAVLNAVRFILPSSSSEEEDHATAAAPRLTSHAQASSSNHSLGLATAAAATAGATTNATTNTFGATTIYHPDYIEEARLRRQIAQQHQQQFSAFFLGLTTAVGFCATRWLLRRRRGKNGGASAGALATARRPAQPVPQ